MIEQIERVVRPFANPAQRPRGAGSRFSPSHHELKLAQRHQFSDVCQSELRHLRGDTAIMRRCSASR